MTTVTTTTTTTTTEKTLSEKVLHLSLSLSFSETLSSLFCGRFVPFLAPTAEKEKKKSRRRRRRKKIVFCVFRSLWNLFLFLSSRRSLWLTRNISFFCARGGPLPLLGIIFFSFLTGLHISLFIIIRTQKERAQYHTHVCIYITHTHTHTLLRTQAYTYIYIFCV